MSRPRKAMSSGRESTASTSFPAIDTVERFQAARTAPVDGHVEPGEEEADPGGFAVGLFAVQSGRGDVHECDAVEEPPRQYLCCPTLGRRERGRPGRRLGRTLTRQAAGPKGNRNMINL